MYSVHSLVLGNISMLGQFIQNMTDHGSTAARPMPFNPSDLKAVVRDGPLMIWGGGMWQPTRASCKQQQDLVQLIIRGKKQHEFSASRSLMVHASQALNWYLVIRKK